MIINLQKQIKSICITKKYKVSDKKSEAFFYIKTYDNI